MADWVPRTETIAAHVHDDESVTLEDISEEIMSVAASRTPRNSGVCFAGIGSTSTAARLARLTHAPDSAVVCKPGPIGAKPPLLPLSIRDGNLDGSADTVVSTPEIFRYWPEGDRIDVGFLGAAQLDRFANINTTVVDPYNSPKVRMTGAGGAPETSSPAKESRNTATIRRASIAGTWFCKGRTRLCFSPGSKKCLFNEQWPELVSFHHA